MLINNWIVEPYFALNDKLLEETKDKDINEVSFRKNGKSACFVYLEGSPQSTILFKFSLEEYPTTLIE